MAASAAGPGLAALVVGLLAERWLADDGSRPSLAALAIAAVTAPSRSCWGLSRLPRSSARADWGSPVASPSSAGSSFRQHS